MHRRLLQPRRSSQPGVGGHHRRRCSQFNKSAGCKTLAGRLPPLPGLRRARRQRRAGPSAGGRLWRLQGRLKMAAGCGGGAPCRNSSSSSRSVSIAASVKRSSARLALARIACFSGAMTSRRSQRMTWLRRGQRSGDAGNDSQLSHGQDGADFKGHSRATMLVSGRWQHAEGHTAVPARPCSAFSGLPVLWRAVPGCRQQQALLSCLA